MDFFSKVAARHKTWELIGQKRKTMGMERDMSLEVTDLFIVTNQSTKIKGSTNEKYRPKYHSNDQRWMEEDVE